MRFEDIMSRIKNIEKNQEIKLENMEKLNSLLKI